MSKLKSMRLKSKIRQAELARMLNISRASVNDMEKKGIKKPSTAVKYAQALPGVRWQDLLEEPYSEASQ